MLLTRHVNRLHKQVKPYLCPHCGKAFYDSWNMKNHVKKLHLGEDLKRERGPTEMLQCEHCGKELPNLKIDLLGGDINIIEQQPQF